MWFQAKIKIEKENLCVYYWIALYMDLTFRYGRDIVESSRDVACHPSVVVWCRVLTEFTWYFSEYQNWNKKSLRLLWNRFVFGLNFNIRMRYRRIKQKMCMPSFSSFVMSSFDWIYVISSENQIEIENLCVYYWIALYLVLTFRYGRDIGESSRKVACHPSLVVWCRVLTEFT